MTRTTVIALLTAAVAAFAGVVWIAGGSTAEEVPSAAVPMEEPSAEVIFEAGGPAGYSYAVAVSDSIAVFNRGAELVVLGVSDPRHPIVLGSVTMPALVRDVVLAGSLAFIAADSAGLNVVDLSDPTHPILRGSFHFGDRANGVAVGGGHAYVAARSQGLRVLDIADPANLTEVGHIVTPDEAVDVVVREEYAYVAAWYESMRVIDVSEPANPKEVSFASYDSYDNGAAWSVDVEGDIGLNAIPEMGLRTVDISNPRDVKLYKVYRGLFAPAGVAARGTIAFVADQSAGFRVLDLSEPAQLVEIGSVTLAGTPLQVVLDGDHAYVAAREGGLRIVDVSNPNDPNEVAFVDTDDRIVDVAYGGRTLLAAGSENGVYTVANDLERLANGTAQRIQVVEDRLVTAGTDGVRFYNRSDSTSGWTNALRVQARGAAVRGRLVVAAAGTDGLQLFDGSRRVGEFIPQRFRSDSLSREQLLRTAVSSWDVILDGDLAIGAFDDGIRIVDISAPSRPRMVDAVAVPQRVYRLVKVGDAVFAAGDDGFRVYRKKTLAELAYVKTPSFATSLAVQNGLAYVGDLSGTVTVVDVADYLTQSDARSAVRPAPTEPPKIIGAHKVAGRIHGLAVSGDELAVAAGWEGVRVLRLPLPEN